MAKIDRTLSISPQFLLKSLALIAQNPHYLLQIRPLRLEFAQERIALAKIAAGPQQMGVETYIQDDSVDMIENTIRHNIESLDPTIADFRPIGLMGPLLGMDQVMQNMADAKILIIGPRTEAEILWYISMGFSAANITGLDLISYSDYITLGDMHAMPFEENSFDIVVFSWVLGYSRNQQKAIDEAVRVVRVNGLVAIGEQWDPTPIDDTDQWMKQNKGYSLRGTVTTCAQDLVDLFSPYKTRIRFLNEPLQSQKSRVGWISIIAEVQEKFTK